MRADKKTEAEVISSINKFLEAYSRRDLEGTTTLLAPDQDTLLIGTGIDEKILGIENARKQIKRDYDQASDISIKLGPVAVSASGPVAWTYADSIWRIKLRDQDMIYNWRWTMVLEKRQGKWLIVQSHLSAPAQGQSEGQSYPSK